MSGLSETQRRTDLYKCPDNAEGSEAQVLKGAGFGSRVEEWIQEQWYMSYDLNKHMFNKHAGKDAPFKNN